MKTPLFSRSAVVCSLAIVLTSPSSPVCLRAQPTGSTKDHTANPLYLLTYDHGGLVLWGHEHFAERLRNAMSWLDRHPRFKIGLDNEAHVYDELAIDDPALLAELRSDLQKYAGRFGIGTSTYGQPLSTFINEESNVRQLVYAIRADQEHFGYRPVVYLMSEHAMHSQMPQLLAGCGFQGAVMRTHFMMYGYNPTFDGPIGWWVGLDGSRLPAVPTYKGEGAQFGKTTVDNWILTRYPGPECKTSLDDFRRQFASIQPLLASRADDSGLRKETLVSQYEANPAYRWILLDELLGLLPKPVAEFKTTPNDFGVRMPWGYCGNEIWNLSREAEVQVLTAERLAAMALLLGGASHEPELKRAWQNLLVGQHHDIQICGLLPDARQFLSASLAASKPVADQSLQFVAERMKGEGLLQVTVFNPLSWRRSQWFEADLALVAKGLGKEATVRHNGRDIPSVLLSAERHGDGKLLDGRLAFLADVPGLAFASYAIVPEPQPSNSALPRVNIDAPSLHVVTPYLDARLAPEGGIAALSDRRTGRPLLRPERRSAFFAGKIDGVDCESRGRWLVEAAGPDAPWATAREYGFIANIPYTLIMTFRSDTPQIDCRVSFHFSGQKIGQLSNQPRDSVAGFVHEQKLRFRLFPSAGEQVTGVRDLPFAAAETPDRYVQGLYWTAVAGKPGGLAFFNRGTMGSVREADGGFSIPLAYAMYYIWGTRMLSGDFNYEFALYPFNGAWSEADLHRHALEYSFPIAVSRGRPHRGPLADEISLIEAEDKDVILSALYSEQERVYARLYESQGRSVNSTFRYTGGPARLTEVNLLGKGDKPITDQLTFHPWQIRTLRIGK